MIIEYNLVAFPKHIGGVVLALNGSQSQRQYRLNFVLVHERHEQEEERGRCPYDNQQGLES